MQQTQRTQIISHLAMFSFWKKLSLQHLGQKQTHSKVRFKNANHVAPIEWNCVCILSRCCVSWHLISLKVVASANRQLFVFIGQDVLPLDTRFCPTGHLQFQIWAKITNHWSFYMLWKLEWGHRPFQISWGSQCLRVWVNSMWKGKQFLIK